jgi:hypothetical protein
MPGAWSDGELGDVPNVRRKAPYAADRHERVDLDAGALRLADE